LPFLVCVCEDRFDCLEVDGAAWIVSMANHVVAKSAIPTQCTIRPTNLHDRGRRLGRNPSVTTALTPFP
jgi:hypothetical protein